jgi:DNA-binding FrmR family transcriptional regulator
MRRKKRDKFILRMRRIKGQVEGVIRMYEEQRDCDELIQQMTAAKAALEKAMGDLLKEELCQRLHFSNRKKAELIINRILKAK